MWFDGSLCVVRWRSLRVVCCVLIVAFCALLVACCLPMVDRCSLMIVGWWLVVCCFGVPCSLLVGSRCSVVWCLVCCWLFVVCCLCLVARCPLRVVICFLWVVCYLLDVVVDRCLCLLFVVFILLYVV